MHLHRASIADEELRYVEGYRTLSAARTIMDTAREFGSAPGLVAADYALRIALVDQRDLQSASQRCAGWPGSRAASAIERLADGNAESPLESLSRLAIATRHLPPPTLQQVILTEHGVFVGRADFYWDEFGVVGEADGDLKYDTRLDLTRERVREQALERLGLTVVRWRWPDLNNFDGVAEQLCVAFKRGVRPDSRHRRWLCTQGGRYFDRNHDI